MTTKQEDNRAIIKKWYDEMWGKGDSARIVECIAPHYLRHDLTGSNNTVTAESYTAMVEAAMANNPVREFTYFSIVEGDFIGALGRFLIGEDTQWDWVQLFRTQDGRLAETWLPGMGGTLEMAFPRPDIAWTESTVPLQTQLPMTPEKRIVENWFSCLGAQTDATSCLAPKVRVHDLLDADAEISDATMQTRWLEMMQHDLAYELELFLIQEGNMVFATGKWLLGDDRRAWNWIQAFRVEHGKIHQTWITSIGGTDGSIKHELRSWGQGVVPISS